MFIPTCTQPSKIIDRNVKIGENTDLGQGYMDYIRQ